MTRSSADTARKLPAWLPLVLLAALTLLSLGFDLWAVVTDQRPSGGDTYTNTTLHMASHLTQEDPWDIFATDGPKGPTAPLLSLPFLFLLGAVPLATRLVSVVAHTALVVQTYDLGRRLSGDRWTGLAAALLLTTSPMVFGWARLDFHEVVLAMVVAGTLQLMVRARLDGPLLSLALGLVLGVGILTKLGYVVFMVAPGIWFVLRRLRGPKSAAYLALTLAAMTAVAFVWVKGNIHTIFGNYHMTASFREPWLDKAVAYVSDPATYLLLLAGLASAAVLFVKRLADRWVVALYVAFVAVSLVQFAMLFDYWTRYTVPIYPVAAVLAATGGVMLLRRLPKVVSLAAAVLLSVGSVGWYLKLNLEPVAGPNPREFVFGMTAPDPRPYDALPRAVTALRRYGGKLLLFVEPGPAHTRWAGMEQIWNFREVKIHKYDPGDFMRNQPKGKKISVLFIRPQGSHSFAAPGDYPGRCPPLSPPDRPSGAPVPGEVRWLAGQTQRRCLKTAVDPDGLAYIAYRVEGTVPVELDPPRR